MKFKTITYVCKNTVTYKLKVYGNLIAVYSDYGGDFDSSSEIFNHTSESYRYVLLNRNPHTRYKRTNTVLIMDGQMHQFLESRYELLRKAIRNFKFADELEGLVNENA